MSKKKKQIVDFGILEDYVVWVEGALSDLNTIEKRIVLEQISLRLRSQEQKIQTSKLMDTVSIKGLMKRVTGRGEEDEA